MPIRFTELSLTPVLKRPHIHTSRKIWKMLKQAWRRSTSLWHYHASADKNWLVGGDISCERIPRGSGPVHMSICACKSLPMFGEKVRNVIRYLLAKRTSDSLADTLNKQQNWKMEGRKVTIMLIQPVRVRTRLRICVSSQAALLQCNYRCRRR